MSVSFASGLFKATGERRVEKGKLALDKVGVQNFLQSDKRLCETRLCQQEFSNSLIRNTII